MDQCAFAAMPLTYLYRTLVYLEPCLREHPFVRRDFVVAIAEEVTDDAFAGELLDYVVGVEVRVAGQFMLSSCCCRGQGVHIPVSLLSPVSLFHCRYNDNTTLHCRRAHGVDGVG